MVAATETALGKAPAADGETGPGAAPNTPNTAPSEGGGDLDCLVADAVVDNEATEAAAVQAKPDAEVGEVHKPDAGAADADSVGATGSAEQTLPGTGLSSEPAAATVMDAVPASAAVVPVTDSVADDAVQEG